MLSVARYPHMNRAQRRDPAKHERALWPAAGTKASPLLLSLICGVGLMQPEYAAPVYAPPIREAGKSVITKALSKWQRFKAYCLGTAS